MDERTIAPEAAFSADDIREHDEHDHIATVFADRQHAEAAVEDLRALGLGSEHLGVAVHSGDPVVFEHDTDAEMFHDTKVSAAAGTPIGFLAGLGLAVVAAPEIAVGGMLLMGGVGAAWGAFLGAYIGIGIGDKASTEHEQIEVTPLEPGEVLVVVSSHGHGDAVRDVMQSHQGRIRELSLTS